MVAAAVGGAALVGGLYSANRDASASRDAAGQQSAAADRGIYEQQRQFDATQALLAPYVQAGTGALGGQQALAGLSGADAQQSAISALQQGPQYQAALQAGNNNILANASATGNLRGGNVQSALGQFAPQLLAQTINDQYARLGGISSMGLGAATQTGNFGQAASSNVSNLLQQQGAALAGGSLAQGRAQAGYANAITSGIGSYFGAGGKF